MAPNPNINTGYFWLETNRHSPRIFNRNATKLDVSTVNNKIDFMKSLDLFCIQNTRESFSKVNWEVVLPRNSLPLKKCSVVISGVKCDVCGQSLKNQTDMEDHKHLNHYLINKDYEKNYDVIRESSVLNNCENQIMQENYIECNNNNTLKSEYKIKSFKKNIHKRRSKDAVTKVTLKIGGEIISKVYCKKKYLNKICSKEQRISEVHHHESCRNCNKIKNILHNSKINATTADIPLSRLNESDTEQSDRNIARLRKMAAALVEHELRRTALQYLERSNFLEREAEECKRLEDEDAIVPEISNEILSVDSTIEDDDIQEVLHITKNAHNTNKARDTCEFSTPFERQTLATTKNYEIITIDDEIYDACEDDCVIVDEQLSHQNSLTDEENSYIFHVSDKDGFNSNTLNIENTQTCMDIRKSFSNSVTEDDTILEKQEIENALLSQFNNSKNFNRYKTQKEKKICQESTINLSQFALPLREIHF